jgi:hypothetical protein
VERRAGAGSLRGATGRGLLPGQVLRRTRQRHWPHRRHRSQGPTPPHSLSTEHARACVRSTRSSVSS